jgi:hypothetical protein
MQQKRTKHEIRNYVREYAKTDLIKVHLSWKSDQDKKRIIINSLIENCSLRIVVSAQEKGDNYMQNGAAMHRLYYNKGNSEYTGQGTQQECGGEEYV